MTKYSRPPGLIATYRLQLSENFTFHDAEKILPYLKDLGISHIYVSPIFKSAKGSNHGYDVADFSEISAERGGAAAFESFMETLEKLGLKLIIDIVPNHMGVACDNPYWLDVLKHGQKSEFWTLFDFRVEDKGKIKLPILAKSLSETLLSEEVEFKNHPRHGWGMILADRYLPLNDSTQKSLTEQANGKPVEDVLRRLDKVQLQAMIDRQNYRPVCWTEALDEMSYRRFFDVTDLAGVKVEDEKNFNLTHRSIFDLIARHSSIAGLRIDHIDGLAEPGEYLNRLSHHGDHVWVEKILSGDEVIPQEWPVMGTTGYEFIQKINPLFVDADKFAQLKEYWINHIQPEWPDFLACVKEAKAYVLETLFPTELNRLAALSERCGIDNETARIFWRQVTIDLPVYRTYFEGEKYISVDRDYLTLACKNIPSDPDFKRLQKILFEPKTPDEQQLVREWQQLSGPAMAKGLEDTAHYRFTPVPALNEVGCEAELHGDDYFSWAQRQLSSHPASLLASSTHDTKRGEDTRARLYAIAQSPAEWIRFFETMEQACFDEASALGISKAMLYFMLQNMIAAWPRQSEAEGFEDRVKAYAVKAAREMKQKTNWLEQNKDYEDNLEKFVGKCLFSKAIHGAIEPYAEHISKRGVALSLAALTLKILGPGVPDIYQGCESWNLSLVDPDNRRPVAFANLAMNLKAVSSVESDFNLTQMLEDGAEGNIKLWLTQRLLQIRSQYIGEREYSIEPLQAADALLSYRIKTTDNNFVVIVRVSDEKHDAQISDIKGRDLISDQVVDSDNQMRLSEMLSNFPVAVILC